MDSYQYYGTDDLYLASFIKFLKPGGQIGIVVPGFTQEFETPPAHFTRARANGGTFWADECWCFHSAAWWQRHWSKLSVIKDVEAEYQPDAVPDWIRYEKACEEAKTLIFPSEAETLEEDGGRYIALVRVTGRRKE